MITFDFALTPDDYVRGIRAYYARQRSLRILFAMLASSAVLCWGSGMVLNSSFWTEFALVCLTPLLCVGVFIFLVTPWMIGRQARRHERLRCQTTWQVTEERIAVRSTFGESAFDWGTFQRVYETRDYYLLIYSTNNGLVQIVPKRAFPTGEHAEAFRALLARHLLGLTGMPA